MNASSLFTLPDTLPFDGFFKPDMAPWEWVSAIKPALDAFDFSQSERPAGLPAGVHIEGDVHFEPGIKFPAYAHIEGPAWIGPDTEIRPGAFIRGNVIIGKKCIIGNACEFKNCLLMDNVQTPHYNYVGDSILGNGAHLGAGVILSNFRLDQADVRAHTADGRTDTGMRKLGAMLGDHAEVGCNTALQPGTILGKRAIVAPVMTFSGYLPDNSMAFEKPKPQIIPRP